MALTALARKVGQVLADPVLRRWLLARGLRRVPAPPGFVPHRPPYMAAPVALAAPLPAFAAAPGGTGAVVTFRVHRHDFAVDPGNPGALFDSLPADLETVLALHRFAWLNEGHDSVTVAAVWRAWFDRFGTAQDYWAWHPYTTAERAIALLDFAERHFWPGGDGAALMARHVQAIVAGLEYFGEHHTGNHLANNGRGLVHLGLRLGDGAVARLGLDIVLNEAARIFLPSGVLREGSSHYHLLYAARYAELAELAAAHRRPEAAALATVAARARAVAAHLTLPGGLPLIGDISPDIAPAALALPPAAAGAPPVATLAADGWLRCDAGDWAGLWHAAPQGWSHMPGHGHQDCGSFELHWRGQPVFVDLGRGAYGEDGEAALYRSALVHNGLTLDGADPYPPNRPYYDEGFRRMVAGPPPELATAGPTVTLRYRNIIRRWHLGAALALEDQVAGQRAAMIERRLHTPFPTVLVDGAALIETPAGRLRVTADAPLTLLPRIRWLAYGEGVPATAIVAAGRAGLPWAGRIVVEVS